VTEVWGHCAFFNVSILPFEAVGSAPCFLFGDKRSAAHLSPVRILGNLTPSPCDYKVLQPNCDLPVFVSCSPSLCSQHGWQQVP
jgi:hypothetical protein